MLAGNSVQLAGRAGCLPVVSHYPVELQAGERERIAALAVGILEEERNLPTVPPLHPLLDAGLLPWAPSLLVEDHSGILHAQEQDPDLTYTYRALMLAGPGDMLAIHGSRVPAFERYCRETLGLGHVGILSPAVAAPDRAPSLACADDLELVGRIASAAREAGGLNVVPYMATGGAWCLAGRIAQRAGVPVRLAGPPPRLTRQVNDKIWFARRARQLLGERCVPPSDAVYGLVGLVGHLRRLARRSGLVALKLTHSAASAGNLVFDSADILGCRPIVLGGRLVAAMRASGWRQDYPMQVTAWEAPLVASPSVQLWIPERGAGLPVVEGVFDQALTGRTARFSGAMPSDLPLQWRRRIALEAARLALLWQELGYYGRCSFDAVVFGHELDRAELHWVECNGRWGGVSIPMTLANRLRGDWCAGGFSITSSRDDELCVRSTADFLERCADALYRPGVGAGGAILLCPGRLEAGRGIDLLLLGADAAEVRERAGSLLARLAGPAPVPRPNDG